MSAKQIYKLYCDGCGTMFCSDKHRADLTRLDASASGWTFRVVTKPNGMGGKSIDLCADCGAQPTPNPIAGLGESDQLIVDDPQGVKADASES